MANAGLLEQTPVIGVLFVCKGNICRSPMAEGMFSRLVEQEGLSKHFRIDSAGIGGWHEGELPDPRTRALAQREGFPLPTRARKIRPIDFQRYRHHLVMDREVLSHMEKLAAASASEVRLQLMRAFDPMINAAEKIPDLPDPYSGGPEHFEEVHSILARSIPKLMLHLCDQYGL